MELKDVVKEKYWQAALRVLHIDPRSRFPERRSVLTPFER